MKFECKCDTIGKYEELRNNIHNIHLDNEVSEKVCAKLWITRNDITVRVEHLVYTALPIEDIEDGKTEEDMFVCYKVENETDNSYNNKVGSMPVPTDFDIFNLQGYMGGYAKEVIDNIADYNKCETAVENFIESHF
jgi:hypothetical protein